MTAQHHTSQIKLLAVIAAICLLFASCGKSSGNNSSYNDFNNQNNSTSDESNSTENNTLTNDETIDVEKENADGIVEIRKPEHTKCDSRNPLKDASGNPFIFIWKNANEEVPKISKNSKVGIYETYGELDFIPIGTAEPQYTVPMNFIDERDVDDKPDLFSGGIFYGNQGISHYVDNADFDTGNYLKSGNPLEECNGEKLADFVNANCDTFDSFKLIKAEKNQKFEFGYYYGTKWETFFVEACVEYYKVYPKTQDEKITITVPTQKTKEGYYSVDLSTMTPGLYYISTFQCFVELV